MGNRYREGERLHLGLSLSGFGFPSWRRLSSDLDIFGLKHDAQLVRAAEDAKLDFVFRADFAALDVDAASRDPVAHHDPVAALSAFAALTDHIGLIGTASAGLHEPYHIARSYGTLDLLSGGRAGLNVVTTTSRVNFSALNNLVYDDQYPRAIEFTEVLEKLWRSYPSEAIVADRSAGLFFDPSKVRPINHEGKYFQVAGPLNIPSSEQGRPRIVQSGKSSAGRDFAAKYAEAVFGDHFTGLDAAREYSRDLKRRAISYGRDPRTLKILPGVKIYIADTEHAAQSLYSDIRSYGKIDDGIKRLNSIFGRDFSSLELDRPVPRDFLPEKLAFSTHSSIVEHYRDLLLIKPIENVILDDMRLSAFWKIIGTAEQVADELETWFIEAEADGAIILPGVIEDSLPLFFNRVVPILQNRGRFREDYEGATLESHLNER